MENKTNSDNYFEELRRLGIEREKELNTIIREALNNDGWIKEASLQSNTTAKMAKQLQEAMEALSALGNFPTKRDVANIAKMQVQLEEKIDHLEEKLVKIYKKCKEAKRKESKHKKEKKKEYSKKGSKKSESIDYLVNSLIEGMSSIHGKRK
ncbi:hypothetical protein [Peribacillus deserti]|uniref:Uncharacterized protein n=1 Tax=Peribacillus deserti TaxID=673318 RepID=A0A2N5M4T8_9BACI|nr:hypothetical protein [Peribacillus deserti]PLT29378.1 hypothetical protein CUU66_13200 [Peribacillus deserti]